MSRSLSEFITSPLTQTLLAFLLTFMAAVDTYKRRWDVSSTYNIKQSAVYEPRVTKLEGNVKNINKENFDDVQSATECRRCAGLLWSSGSLLFISVILLPAGIALFRRYFWVTQCNWSTVLIFNYCVQMFVDTCYCEAVDGAVCLPLLQ